MGSELQHADNLSLQGVSSNDWHRIMSKHMMGAVTAYSGTGVALSVVAGRLSYTMRLKGPALSVDTGGGLRGGGTATQVSNTLLAMLLVRLLCNFAESLHSPYQCCLLPSPPCTLPCSLLLLPGLPAHGLQQPADMAEQHGGEQRRQPQPHPRHLCHVPGTLPSAETAWLG